MLSSILVVLVLLGSAIVDDMISACTGWCVGVRLRSIAVETTDGTVSTSSSSTPSGLFILSNSANNYKVRNDGINYCNSAG